MGRGRFQGAAQPPYARTDGPARPTLDGTSNRTKRREAACVDSRKCIGCGACEAVCTTKAISLKETAIVDQSRCTGCGACLLECPNSAISMRRVTDGKGEAR